MPFITNIQKKPVARDTQKIEWQSKCGFWLLTQRIVSGTISKDSFELLCRDGTRRPIDDYRACNWGTVPSDAIVASSASTVETRQKFQKFLEKASEIYSQNIQLNSTYDDRNRNINNRNEYDQFGNRIQNRFKRQNFGGNYNNQNQQQYDPTRRNEGDYTNQNQQQYDPTRRNEGDYNNQNRQFDPNNPFDNTQYGQEDPNRQYGGNQFQNNQLGQNERNRSTNPYATDPFSRDPYKLNKDQYGVNIDPYGSPEDARDRSREPFFGPNRNNTAFESPDVPYNGTYYEVFNMFESSPKYGIKGNLLFQVINIM